VFALLMGSASAFFAPTSLAHAARVKVTASKMAANKNKVAAGNGKVAAGKDIVATAVEAGTFKTLAAALGAAGLVDALKGPGPFTVFAPTDEAFAKLPKGTIDALLKDIPTLTAILTYHILSGEVKADAVVKSTGENGRPFAETVNGKALRFRTSGDAVMVDGAKVTAADIMCSNGVIHVVDSVILPSETISSIDIPAAMRDYFHLGDYYYNRWKDLLYAGTGTQSLTEP